MIVFLSAWNVRNQIDDEMIEMELQKKRLRILSNWLFAVCFLVLSIVVVGGATRLTRSGLSIVDWKPVAGVVPPLNQSQWQIEFDRYKEFPEYKKINHAMSLSEFKGIFIWEYMHRLLGRLVGLAFLFPFLFFLWRGYLHGLGKMQFIVMFVLGGLQGLLGWYMVKSGLVKMPHVSHYRLASHLLLAFLVYSYMFYVALQLRGMEVSSRWKLFRHKVFSREFWSVEFTSWLVVMVFLVLQIFYGALTAGLKAGLLANTFPLMNGVLIPDLWSQGLGALSIFELPLTVQFIHRLLGWSLFAGVPAFVAFLWPRLPKSRQLLAFLVLMVFVQFSLGVATLLLHVPVLLGVLHQVGSLVLLSLHLIVFYDINHEIQ